MNIMSLATHVRHSAYRIQKGHQTIDEGILCKDGA